MVSQKIPGHENLKAILKRTLEKNTIAHAWIFSGDTGSGKETIAREYSKTLLCSNRQESLAACDRCSSCQQFESNNHPDFCHIHPVGKSRQIRRDDIQEMLRFLSLKSYLGSYKVVFIEDAGRLNVSSANTLLKSLEEPPEKTVFILGAKREFELLATIRSRCLSLHFAPQDKETFLNYFKQSDTQELIQAHHAYQLCEGHLENISKPIIEKRLEDQELIVNMASSWLERGNLALIDATENILSVLEFEQKSGEKEIKQTLKNKGDLDKHIKAKLEEQLNANLSGNLRSRLDEILKGLESLFRDLYIFQSGLDNENLHFQNQVPLLQKLASKINGFFEVRLHAIMQSRKRLLGTVNQKLALESLLLSTFEEK